MKKTCIRQGSRLKASDIITHTHPGDVMGPPCRPLIGEPEYGRRCHWLAVGWVAPSSRHLPREKSFPFARQLGVLCARSRQHPRPRPSSAATQRNLQIVFRSKVLGRWHHRAPAWRGQGRQAYSSGNWLRACGVEGSWRD